MPEASQGRRVWDLSDEMIKERRWSFELALRRELDETDSEKYVSIATNSTQFQRGGLAGIPKGVKSLKIQTFGLFAL